MGQRKKFLEKKKDFDESQLAKGSYLLKSTRICFFFDESQLAKGPNILKRTRIYCGFNIVNIPER